MAVSPLWNAIHLIWKARHLYIEGHELTQVAYVKDVQVKCIGDSNKIAS